jgi:hypothetical protein
MGTTYSPDGKHIGYVETYLSGSNYGDSLLYRMNALNGSNRQLIYDSSVRPTAPDVIMRSPDWGVKVQR